MAMEKLGIKHMGLLLFGLILLMIGLWGYPYQTIGMMLDLFGIIFIALGFLYSPQKKLPPPGSPPQP